MTEPCKLAPFFLAFLCATCCPAEERQLVSGSRLTLETEVYRSASVRCADFDGDGDLDIVLANGRHWPQQNFLFLNQGRARFNVAQRIGSELSTSKEVLPLTL